ncbi:hypothetical protein AVEN_14141-1 [Araneus ventricosus]|uniref:Uncharacterized protein n=1 Tax=Araneus ventricosus TaxID=182803 RepID=A0A4Y2FYW6_ARAVE|nr:hypothetical protein AVEN_14141-1 [Araneus ventricosus]
MGSRIQMKKTSATGATGCKQPGKKTAKERESSRLSVFIYTRWRKILQLPQAGSQLQRAKHDRDRQQGDQRRGPNLLIRIRYI